MWNTDAYAPIVEKLKAHEVPERYPPETIVDAEIGHGLDEGFFAVRDDIIRASGYTILTMEWLRPFAEWIGSRRCLEVMSGCGSLSKCLQDLGVDIICTDSYEWSKKAAQWFETPWTAVEKVNAVDAIRKFGAQIDIVICAWPYMDDSCHQALLAMRKVNPRAQMVYIGEPPSWDGAGATANEEFFKDAIPVEDESFETAVANYISCCLLHDKPMLYW